MDTQVLPKFHVRLFGGFALLGPKGEALEPPRKILRALIALLCLPPSAGWSRDELTNLLWGDRDPVQARASLRQALAELRHLLGNGSLRADREIAVLDPNAVHVDAVEFKQLAKKGQLEQAAELLAGPLLDGVSLPGGAFADWLQVERAQSDEMAMSVLERLLATQSGESAIETARHLLRVDPCREESHRTLIRLYSQQGSKSRALHQYQVCREQLKLSLGVQPDNETEQLFRDIQSGKGVTVAPAGIQNTVTAHNPKTGAVLAMNRPTQFVAVGGLVLLLLVSLVWWNNRPLAPSQLPFVAVLPFQDLTGDSQSALLARGLTEDIITDLAGVSEFRVIARDSTAVFAGKPIDPVAVGLALNATYVVDGAIQRSGGHVRVSAQLIDASNGKSLWSQNWDRPDGSFFDIQTEISRLITNRLAGGDGLVQAAGRVAAHRKPPSNLTAYEFYLLGTEKLERITRQDVDDSIRLLNRAVELDPGLARAWVELFHAHSVAGNFGNDMDAHYKLAFAAAERAMQLDPSDAEAQAVYAMSFVNKNDFARAKAEFDKALRMAPHQFEILAFYAGNASTMGEPEQGAQRVDEAIALNPNYPMWSTRMFAYAYYMVGRYEDALRMMERIEDKNLGTWLYPYKAGALAAVGRHEEARKTVAAALKTFPGITIEGTANEPGYNPLEKKRVIETMRLAGFPPCAKPEVLAKIENPIRLEECKAGQ